MIHVHNRKRVPHRHTAQLWNKYCFRIRNTCAWVWSSESSICPTHMSVLACVSVCILLTYSVGKRL